MDTITKFTRKRLSPSRFGAVVALAIALMVVAILPESTRKARAQDGGGTIVGTWVFTSTLNTPPGAPPFVFTELGSFIPGGIFIDTFSLKNSANPFVPPPVAVDFSDKFGTWRQVGDDSNQFAITFKEFLFAGADTPTALYGPILFPGQNVGVATIEAVATLHSGAGGDTITGPFTFQLTNLQGTVVGSGSGTFSATRLQIQPLATD